MKPQITQSWLSFVFHYGFEHIEFCWKVQKAEGAFMWRQVTFWASLQWFWVSHHNHLWNVIVQLGCLLVVTEQKSVAFQGTVSGREDLNKACVKTFRTSSQDPSHKQINESVKPENSSPSSWSHFITTLAQLEQDPKPTKVKGRISIDFQGVWIRS